MSQARIVMVLTLSTSCMSGPGRTTPQANSQIGTRTSSVQTREAVCIRHYWLRGFASEFTQEPQLRETEFAVNRRRSDAQNCGGLFDGESAKEAEFDDLTLAGIDQS